MLENINYKDYKKSNDIHGTVLYPAAMIAPLQNEVLSTLINNNVIKTIFDPFHGSGTALYEAALINKSIHLYGCDINPLANLITKVKLQGVNTNIQFNLKKLKSFLVSPTHIEPYNFPNIDKWLREDIKNSIALLRTAIMEVDDYQNRLFFWYILCDIIRKYSNTRSSTYKLHIKTVEMIKRIKNNIIEEYINAIEKHISKFKSVSSTFRLYKCNVLDEMPRIGSRVFDISITSPPYGDNATTVTYGQFSMLALYTIDPDDLDLEGWELDNYSSIDSHSLGGILPHIELTDFETSIISPYLKKIVYSKHRKVIRFFSDYFQFLKELARVTNQYIVLTLGNRTVDRIKIKLSDITKQFLSQYGFAIYKEGSREILNKRTPKFTSNVDYHPVESMNKEFILIFSRVGSI